MERFQNEEKPFLKALPAEPFIMKRRAKAKVKMNYHVILGEDWHQYSVPYQYIGKKTILIEHMPESHKKYKEQRGWTGDDFMEKASTIGDNTAMIMEQILSSRTFIEQTYDGCIGVLRLADKYGPDRLEAACKRASQSPRVNFTIIKNILKNNQDKAAHAENQVLPFLPLHDNIRGPESYK